MTGFAGRPRALLLCSAAALLGGLVYLNALDNPFVYDDHRTVMDNGSIRRLSDARAIVMHDVTRPLVNLSYAIDRAIWGPGPFGFHLSNLLLHLLNVVLLFVMAWRLAGDRAGRHKDEVLAPGPPIVGFASAALFAVHPMMTEAVGYVSSRPDVLYASLFLSGFLCGRRWLRDGGTRWWLLTICFWLAALLAKESAVMLPAVLFCYDRLVLLPDARARRRSLWLMHVPLFGFALLAGIVRVIVFVYVERDGFTPIAWREVLAQADVTWRYLGLLLVPVGQTIFHDVPPVGGLLEARTFFTGVALVGLIAAVVVSWRARRIDSVARFGVLWFMLLLFPAALLATIGRADRMAEHRTYLASCGLFLVIGVVADWVLARLSGVSRLLRFAAGAAFVVVLLSLGARTMLRNAVWADPIAVWREAAEKAPGNFLPRTVLGESLHAAGRHEEAVPAYRTALALNPRDEMGYLKLAVCLSELGRPREAVAAIRTLEQNVPGSPVVSTGLGVVALLSGDVVRARERLLATLDQDPHNVLALQWLAVLEEQTAKPAEALRRCEEIRELTPWSSSTEDCISRNRSRTR